MKCSRCGAESAEDSTYCSECGAILDAPPLPPLAAEEERTETTVGAYPPVFGPPRPSYQERSAVRSLNLAELLFLISGILLLSAGFQNMGAGVAGLPVQFLLLGIVATLFGLVQIALVVMPGMMSGLERFRGTLTIVIALLFLIWGMAAAFGPNVGANGGMIVAAGLSTTLGLMLREGMIR